MLTVLSCAGWPASQTCPSSPCTVPRHDLVSYRTALQIACPTLLGPATAAGAVYSMVHVCYMATN